MALFVLRSNKELAEGMAKSLIDVKEKIRFCSICFNLTDDECWRLESRTLPELTEVGAFRVQLKGQDQDPIRKRDAKSLVPRGYAHGKLLPL